MFSTQLTPHMEMVLQGIKKEQNERQAPRTQLPITIQIMHKLRQLLQQNP